MKKIVSFLSVLMLCASVSSAQDFNTAYFLGDVNQFGYRVNPAAVPQAKGHIGFIVSNLVFNANSNIGVSDVLYPVGDGHLVTGLNSQIPADKFLGNLKPSNILGVGLNENLFSYGTKAGSGYFSFDINLKAGADMNLPKSIFEILKSGAEGNVYAIDRIEMDLQSYAEVAMNYSFHIGDNITAGLGVKGLIGLAEASAELDHLNVKVHSGAFDVKGHGTASISTPGLSFGTDDNGNVNLSDFKFDSPKPAGLGVAVDLGVQWKTPVDGLTADFAVLNIGGISWTDALVGQFKADHMIDPADVDVEDIYSFTNANGGKEFKSVPLTVNAGARYAMPFYKKMSVGALATVKKGYITTTDFRVGFDVAPLKMFAIAGSAGVGTMGTTFGAAVKVKLAILDVFAGVDGIFTRVTPQYVPVDAFDSTAKLGVSLVF